MSSTDFQKHLKEHYNVWDNAYLDFKRYINDYKDNLTVKLNEPANSHLLDLSNRSELIKKLQWKNIAEHILLTKKDFSGLKDYKVLGNFLQDYFNEKFKF